MSDTQVQTQTPTQPARRPMRFRPSSNPSEIPVPIVHAIVPQLAKDIVILRATDGQRFFIHSDKVEMTSVVLGGMIKVNKLKGGKINEYNINSSSKTLRCVIEEINYAYKTFLHVHTKLPKFTTPPELKEELFNVNFNYRI